MFLYLEVLSFFATLGWTDRPKDLGIKALSRSLKNNNLEAFFVRPLLNSLLFKGAK